ncbi:MAG: ATP-grasp fold amidoligase family protein [Candidatus Omnitrophota bacterium]
MNKIKMSSLRYSLTGAVFNLRERLTRYRHEKKNFKKERGFNLNLKNPRSWSEKVVWKKLYDRNPLLPVVADKYRVRQYLKDVLGEKEAEEILIPLLYVTDRPETIPFDHFPEEYIIKANHGSGMNIVVDKNNPVNRKEIVARCGKWLSKPFALKKHEWAYQKIKRKIVVEKLLRDENGKIPADYKFKIFHGRCHLIQVLYDRFADRSIGWYSPEWNYLNIYSNWELANYMEKPAQLDFMIALAEFLGMPFDFIRVDLYLVNGRIYFGELTNYPESGRASFTPVSYDFELGSKWKIVPEYWNQGNYKIKDFVIRTGKYIFASQVDIGTGPALEGKGVFAKRDFSQGDHIGFLEGKIRRNAVKESMQFSTHLHIEPDLNNPVRYLNHSCDANAYFCGRSFHAWRPIKKGEEITIDYNCTEYAVSAPFKCNCNTAGCVGEIKGFSFLTDDQKKKRKGKLAEWCVYG